MNKGTTKAERTRMFIVEQTADIFNKKGFAGTSMSDLTEATGLTKGSIYGNFENKEEVALAVFEYNCTRIRGYINAEMDKADTFYNKLMVYGRVYKNIIRAAANRGGCPILNTAIDADDTNEVLKQKVSRIIMNWEEHIVRLIKEGSAAGEFKQHINEQQTAVSIIALIEGGVMLAKATSDPARMDMVLNTVELLISNMKAE